MLYRDESILKQQQKPNQDNIPNYGLEPQIQKVRTQSLLYYNQIQAPLILIADGKNKEHKRRRAA